MGDKEEKDKIRSPERRLFSNTFFLYLLTFSSQFFSFLTVPYLTRVLGASVYGKVGVALAYMAYVQIILDFGFILSATKMVVEKKDDSVALGRLVTAVLLAKAMFSLGAGTVFGIFIFYNSDMKGDWLFYFLYLGAYVFNALMPDFFYRGMERMKVITYRTIFVKALFTVMTFIFIHQASDYWLIPLFNLMGNAVAAILMYMDMAQNYQVTFQRIDMSFWRHMLKVTLPFFISRAASTTYQALNAIILSFSYGTDPIIGCYASADKIVSLGKSCCGPVADSLYPYMLKERNHRLVKRMLIIFMPVIIVGVSLLFIYANQICIWLFGVEYESAGLILRCLLPILLVIFPTYILCFPVMVPLGLSKWANFSNVIGMCIQLSGLLILVLIDLLNVYSICILSSITEIIVFAFRLGVVMHHMILLPKPKVK